MEHLQRAYPGKYHNGQLRTLHQLRHNAATYIGKEFGLDTARVILDYGSAVITEVYAEQDQ